VKLVEEMTLQEEARGIYKELTADPEYPEDRAREQSFVEAKRRRAQRALESLKEDVAGAMPAAPVLAEGETVTAQKMREAFAGLGVKLGGELTGEK